MIIWLRGLELIPNVPFEVAGGTVTTDRNPTDRDQIKGRLKKRDRTDSNW